PAGFRHRGGARRRRRRPRPGKRPAAPGAARAPPGTRPSGSANPGPPRTLPLGTITSEKLGDLVGPVNSGPVRLESRHAGRYFANASFIRRAAMPNELSGPYRFVAPMTTATSCRPPFSAEAVMQKPAGAE